jgi:nicotinamide-nucleotide amidase
MFPKPVRKLAEEVLNAARQSDLKIATAESCTGGLIAGALTEIPGSSDVVDRGFVTYSNQAKCDMLGVSIEMLIAHGAVSEQVARAMAEGALAHSSADVAVSVTGIAGPGGGTATKPVGLVHLACARKGHETLHERRIFTGDRGGVRMSAVKAALKLIQRSLANAS